MTVKKNNRRILFLTVTLFAFLTSGSVFAAGKNILRIHFETAKVKPGTTDVVLNVFYKIDIGRPLNFYEFNCRINYDQNWLRPSTAFFDGTACDLAALNGNAHYSSDVANDNFDVLVLNSGLLDTAKHSLFQIWWHVTTGFKDSAMIAPVLFDVGDPAYNTIDSVFIDNAVWDTIFHWHPFGLVFLDTTSPPPPKKRNITLSSDSTDVRSDSLRAISVEVSSLDSANIKSGVFEFDVDTSAFDSAAIVRGSLLANSIFLVSQNSTHIAVKFSNPDTSKAFSSAGELLKIVFRGKKISDTVCTGILNPKFSALNSDELIGTVTYKLQGICVLGIKKDTVTGSVSGSADNDFSVTVFPNPARTHIDFVLPSGYSGKKHLMVFDALGRKVFDEVFGSDFHWETALVPAGIYTATVTSFSALQEGRAPEKIKILIIH
jgi:hypothetical protein